MKKLGGWNVNISLRILGYFIKLSFYPLGSWKRLYFAIASKESLTRSWHLFIGPFHLHGFYLGKQLIEIGFDIDHDPFWGTAISAPPTYKVLFKL